MTRRSSSASPFRWSLRPRQGLLPALLLLLCLLLASAPVSRALVTPFAHRFRFEAAGGALGLSNQSAAAFQGVATGAGGYNGGALAALMRWNTFSLVSAFGVERGGRVTVEVTRVAATAASGGGEAAAADVPVVFTLYDDDQWRVYSLLRLREMPLRSAAVLCHYPSSVRFTLTPSGFADLAAATATPVWRRRFDVTKPSLYTLQAQVCGDASVEIEARLARFEALDCACHAADSGVPQGTVTMVNVGFDDRLSEHLAVEDLGLLPLYQVLIVVYSIATLLWIVECYKHRRNAPKICYAVQIALHVKTISVTLKLWYLRELSVSGKHEPFLDTAQRLAESGSSGSLLAVALTGALGWSLTREALSIRERRMLGLIFVLYAAIALSKSLCYDDDSDACRALMLVEYVIQSVLMLTVVIALNFTAAQLRLMLTEARWNNFATPLTYMKLNQFQSFRNLFLLYLLFPTGLLILNLVVVTPPGLWRYDWVNSLISEAATLFVYITIARIVRPLDSYIYARIYRGTDMRGSRDRGHSRSPLHEPPPIMATSVLAATIPSPADLDAMVADAPPGSIVELNEQLLDQFPPSIRAGPHRSSSSSSSRGSASSPSSHSSISPSSSSSMSLGEENPPEMPVMAPSPPRSRTSSPTRSSPQRQVERVTHAVGNS